jgi:hypothetical protein
MSVTVKENIAPQHVTQQLASYFGDGQEITYTLTDPTDSNRFNITSSADVFLRRGEALDFEETDAPFDLTIWATAPGLDNNYDITINCTLETSIEDMNDAPTLYDLDVSRSVYEDADLNTFVGEEVKYTDPDVGQEVTFEIVDGNVGDVFSISACGGQIKVAKATLDYNTQNLYNLTIEGNDGGSPKLTVRGNVLIKINDTDQARPNAGCKHSNTVPPLVVSLRLLCGRAAGTSVYNSRAGVPSRRKLAREYLDHWREREWLVCPVLRPRLA